MLLLPVLALLLAGPGPRWMARFTGFRRSPGPALVAWQAVGLSAVLSALLVGPAALISARHGDLIPDVIPDRKSTRLNSSHVATSYAVFCLKKKRGTAQHRG